MTYPNCTFTTNGLSLLVLIIMLTMGGCTDSSHIEESDMLIVEVPEGHDENIALEELAEPIALIQLETREEAFITSIKDIHFQNEMLIVSTQNNQVLIFDMDGEYFGKLGKKGEGPSEYNFVSALSVDNDEDGKIYLSSGRKLMAYSAEYELLEEVKLDMHFDYLRVLDGQLYGFTQEYGVPVPNGYANRTKFHTISQDMKIEETLEIREVVNDTDVMATPGFKYYLSLVDADRYVYTPNLTPEKILRILCFK
ncbi:6-bladed beta-propeller [Litoribacter populi]|uniref:6-bladed beta-propeller n=1 Tax=Litoribacter populi TaxID=2598460 RepID=UPI00117DB887|nr:6-bladed beta-propeller [Litoribacter populi]